MNNDTKSSVSAYLGPDFQQKLIWQLLVEPEFSKNVLPNIYVEYFDDPYLKQLFVVMRNYYSEHDKVPNLQNGSIDDAIYKYTPIKNESQIHVLKEKVNQIRLWNERVINMNQLYDGEVVRSDTVNFIKQQEYRKLGEFIINKTKTGEIRSTAFNFKVEEKINKIYHIGDEEDYGTDATDDIDNALREEFRQTIPTGIEAIDAVTGNGLGKGEIALVLAPSGVGKTTFLTKVANNGANHHKKVLQIIFEDTVKQIQRKHFALWSQIKLSEIDDNRDTVKQRALDKYDEIKQKGGKLDIVKFSQEDTSIYDIKNWIARQEKKFGYKYDMIVLDYLDCLEPNKKESELLSAELSIVKSFEAMAADYDIPCWSAIQTNRTGFTTEFVEMQSTGGNIKRIQKSHLVMSIAKPDKSDNSNLANLKILKARFAEDGHQFKECIFNNDSLEIKVTDRKYLNGLKHKKYGEDDLNKYDKKAKELTDGNGFHHDKVSETTFDYSSKVGEMTEKLELKEGVIPDNNDLQPEKDFHDKQIKEDDISSSSSPPEKSKNINSGDTTLKVNTTQGGINSNIGKVSNEEYGGVDPSQQTVPEESGETISGSGFDPENFLNTCSSELDEKPNEIDFLKKMRDEQGDIQKE